MSDYSLQWGGDITFGESPFLSDEEQDLLKICDKVDLKKKRHPKTGGGVPLHYDGEHLYTLKTDGHVRCYGATGMKKSRTVAMGQVISAALNRDSCIACDPKGQMAGDARLMRFLEEQKIAVRVLDFRSFDRNGFNLLSPAWELYRAERVSQAMDYLSRVFYALQPDASLAGDRFWVDSARTALASVAILLLVLLQDQPRGREKFHLATVLEYLNQQNKSVAESACNEILRTIHPRNEAFDAVRNFRELLQLPERTYSCVSATISSIVASLLSNRPLLEMLSREDLKIQDLYTTPTCLFLIVPDEADNLNHLVGSLFDVFYSLLVDRFDRWYAPGCPPPCRIHMLCDEVASLSIPQLQGSKISASRSRMIDWVLLYQSESQLEKAYPGSDAIRDNCQHTLFLGSADFQTLEEVSRRCGYDEIGFDGTGLLRLPRVPVECLQRMQKRPESKDALLIGPWLYAPRLPDYESYHFLPKGGYLPQELREEPESLVRYTPLELLRDAKAHTLNLLPPEGGF